ncbi:uncharacterized protein BO80DRAFT_427624 [Aspergillus ibericus CBS 121593]|uniref:Uncharacterized protein n=1 Tax=Aspergillus ibericus CBS 121593 TaxID=1448316 RepID=A0A395GRR0_9EURO|nr:hypothetical protein BO80DRAFT_427624 [Aspergillus ibericus CBS 121593]RAK98096.1 hypothetical protein BO80DRAFT_427624 [Aspergillus ibericus CBS 121593]
MMPGFTKNRHESRLERGQTNLPSIPGRSDHSGEGALTVLADNSPTHQYPTTPKVLSGRACIYNRIERICLSPRTQTKQKMVR